MSRLLATVHREPAHIRCHTPGPAAPAEALARLMYDSQLGDMRDTKGKSNAARIVGAYAPTLAQGHALLELSLETALSSNVVSCPMVLFYSCSHCGPMLHNRQI